MNDVRVVPDVGSGVKWGKGGKHPHRGGRGRGGRDDVNARRLFRTFGSRTNTEFGDELSLGFEVREQLVITDTLGVGSLVGAHA